MAYYVVADCARARYLDTVSGTRIDSRRRVGFKLMRLMRDGSARSLFINRAGSRPVGVWLDAEDHPTSGYAHRPGWHIMPTPEAPHLSERGRAWFRVEFEGWREFERPASQGGRWFLADRMRIIGPAAAAEQGRLF